MTKDEDPKRQANVDELDQAWWNWVNTNCPYKTKQARGKWMNSNAFTYDGAVWTRQMVGYSSNSGKSIVHRDIFFSSNDGRTVGTGAWEYRNRRNDEKQNWGLGRE